MISEMSLPIEPVTLSVAQISELDQKLSRLRHDVNNKLSLIVASVELVRRRPENAERLLNSLDEQPKKIAEIIAQFSADWESALRITRP
jgi:C4-type Zn-finger protein